MKGLKLLLLSLFIYSISFAQTTPWTGTPAVTWQYRTYSGEKQIRALFGNSLISFMDSLHRYATKTQLQYKIDSLGALSSYTFSNGLTNSGGNVTLGGNFGNTTLQSTAGGGFLTLRVTDAPGTTGGNITETQAYTQVGHYNYTSDYSDGYSSSQIFTDRTAKFGVSRVATGDDVSLSFTNPETPGSVPSILVRDDVQHKGLVGLEYYGANADSLTYIQKKYADNISVTNAATYKLKSDSTDATGYQTVGNFFPKGDTRYVTQSTAQNISALKTLGSKSHAATFTIYGTSLGTKFGFNGTWRYSDGYPYKLTKSLNFQLSLKCGTGNTTLTYTNANAASPIPAYTAGDMIGFEVGVNDATNADATTYSTANYTIRVNGLISSAIAAGYPANRIYIFSAFYWTLGDPTRANDIVNATASIASTRGVLYFDGYNTYKSRVLDNTFTLSGGLHPTIAAQTVVAADMQTYLNAYTINSSTEFLNVFDAGSFNTLNSYGSASFTGNTTINNLKLNTSRVSAGDAIGDIYTRDADGFTTPISAVAIGQVLVSKGPGVPPDYSNAPVVTRLTSNQDIFISSARTGGGYSLQINQAFTPVANNQIVSGGLIAPTFVTGTGALTATASGTTSAADGTVTAQATVTTSGTGSGATYTVTTVGNVATVVTMVVAGTGYATGDTFTIAALPGITFTVASLGYTGITRSAMTFNNAPITLTTITTPANPVTGQIWNTTGVFKAFGAAGATRRIVLADDGAPSTSQMLVGNGTDWTRTTVTGTAGTSPVLAGSPTITGATLTGIRPASTFQASTGTTADSLRFASSQRMVEKALAIQSGTGQTAVQTATTLTLGNDTTVIRTVQNSYSKAQVDANIVATGRTRAFLNSNITLALNGDYLATTSTLFAGALPPTTGFLTDGSKLIIVAATGTAGARVTVPSGYTLVGLSGAATPGTGGITLINGGKVQFAPVGTNSYQYYVLSGSVTVN